VFPDLDAGDGLHRVHRKVDELADLLRRTLDPDESLVRPDLEVLVALLVLERTAQKGEALVARRQRNGTHPLHSDHLGRSGNVLRHLGHSNRP